MKIVSWNVNGIRAAWNHGLSAFLDTCDADIYCFQETKTSERLSDVELDGFHSYWAFCERRKGYVRGKRKSGNKKRAPVHSQWNELTLFILRKALLSVYLAGEQGCGNVGYGICA